MPQCHDDWPLDIMRPSRLCREAKPGGLQSVASPVGFRVESRSIEAAVSLGGKSIDDPAHAAVDGAASATTPIMASSSLVCALKSSPDDARAGSRAPFAGLTRQWVGSVRGG
eukprot:CAMPEP_0170312158 /NCGR_PEP_ID=MMETSP0116_2-20130129/56607_1 /TAXON_ID=400756 /ORGANISM="Durinskia baltica, Strain CSIRO CS-38" /LENGTH=111 /DNA_ID=CAMNT_0010564517 /DNA_START=64 /DNA_END=397 /DNA_ORIENTATION=+